MSTDCTALFDSAVGHARQIAELRSLVKKHAVPHGLLFSGPHGVGKRRIAYALAAALAVNSSNADNELKAAQAGCHPDIHWCTLEEGKKDITVESIRKLCSKLRLAPYAGQAAVAIIDNAHLMNIAAANALLMTLEEPTPKSRLILVTHAPHRLPETIVSRCQQVHFSELSTAEIVRIINQALGEEHASAVSTSVQGICEGTLSPFGLEPFVDSASLGITDVKGAAEQLLTVCQQSTEYAELLESLCSAPEPNAQALSTASRIASRGDSPEAVFRAVISFYRKKMKEADADSCGLWAELLTAAIEASQAVQQRSANLTLQLSSLFLRTASGV